VPVYSGADLEGGVRGTSGGLGDGSPPVGSRGEAPAGGLGDRVSQKLEFFFKVHNLKYKAM